MCGSQDYWPAEFERTEFRKARKEHPCEECPRRIEPRERYLYVSGKFEGEMYSHAVCLRCYDLQTAHIAAEHAVGGDGWYVIGDLRAQIGECAREDPKYVAAFRAAYRKARAA